MSRQWRKILIAKKSTIKVILPLQWMTGMRNIDLLTFRASWQCVTAWLAVNECLGNSAEQLVGFLKFEILTLMFLACQFKFFCLDYPFSSTFVLLSYSDFSSSVWVERALASVELRWPPPLFRWAVVWWDQTSVCAWWWQVQWAWRFPLLSRGLQDNQDSDTIWNGDDNWIYTQSTA